MSLKKGCGELHQCLGNMQSNICDIELRFCCSNKMDALFCNVLHNNILKHVI